MIDEDFEVLDANDFRVQRRKLEVTCSMTKSIQGLDFARAIKLSRLAFRGLLILPILSVCTTTFHLRIPNHR